MRPSQVNSDETILVESQLHWIIFLFPTGITIGLIIFIFRQHFLYLLNYGAVALIIYFLTEAFIRYVTTFYTLTNKRLIIRRGLIFVRTWDIPLSQVESTELNQSLLGKIMGYGDLLIDKTGGNQNLLYALDKPAQFRQKLSFALDKLHG